jgi:hypothetical protein
MRRTLACLIAVPIALCVADPGTDFYAHRTRVHAVIKVTEHNAIIQAFVNCRLAAVDIQELSTDASMNLGWLDKGDIVTIQVRGEGSSGHYKLTLERDSTIERIGNSASIAAVEPNRLSFVYSTTAAGHPIGAQGCQSDASSRLAPATSAAAATGKWEGPPGALLELAVPLAPIGLWVLASLGVLALVGLTVGDWRRRNGIKRSTVAAGVSAALTAFAYVTSVTSNDFGIAFGVCVVTGSCASLMAVLVLLAEDLRNICTRLLVLFGGPGSGTS